MIPGKTNYMYFTPEREGTYTGKCAELCGEYHSLMLFNVKVVSAGRVRRRTSRRSATPATTASSAPSTTATTNLPGTERARDRGGASKAT